MSDENQLQLLEEEFHRLLLLFSKAALRDCKAELERRFGRQPILYVLPSWILDALRTKRKQAAESATAFGFVRDLSQYLESHGILEESTDSPSIIKAALTKSDADFKQEPVALIHDLADLQIRIHEQKKLSPDLSGERWATVLNAEKEMAGCWQQFQEQGFLILDRSIIDDVFGTVLSRIGIATQAKMPDLLDQFEETVQFVRHVDRLAETVKATQLLKEFEETVQAIYDGR